MTAEALPLVDNPRANAVSRHVLRVLSGRLSGKAFPLDGRDRLSIGHSLGNDVVLRGSGTRNCAVELLLDADAARLCVVQGQAEVLGRTLEAGEQIVLPSYLPFRIGEYLVAHGSSASARWQDAEKIAGTSCGTATGALQAPSLVDRLVDEAWGRIGGIDRRAVRVLLGIGCVGLLTIAAAEPLQNALTAARGGRVALERELRQAGFPDVSVAQAGDGTMAVTGVVRDEDELGRLRALATQWGGGVVVDAQTGSALASAAADVLQARGVAAHVASIAPGALVVSAGYMPMDRQERLRGELRKDLPAIRRLTFRVDDGLEASPLQAFFTQSGAGLATVVADPPHILTADGSRWFPGATLPTGHHLLSVSPTAIIFEKDRRTEQINL